MKKNTVLNKHLIIWGLIIFISSLHIFTPTHLHSLHYAHAIFQKLYYIPIILAAYYFSLKLAILYAVLCGLIYAPHIFFQWAFDTSHNFRQYVEISMFIVIASVLGVLFEIRRKQQKQIMHQQKQIAKEKQLGLLGTLAAGLAHEIRNPLGGLLGSAEILRESLGEKHPKIEFIHIIESELKRVNNKLNEFMDFARPKQLELIPNSINDIIDEVNKLLQTEFLKSEVKVKTDFATKMPLIKMDAEQIKQVILNIVLNSLKALPKGGILDIKTEYNNREIVASFVDDGPGILLEEIETIFEPFFTKKEKGTGLGLAISKQLVEAHHGTLNAVYQKKGAYFELRLPRG